MFARFKTRSYEPENIDVGTYTPDEYEGCLVELRRVNRWLGDSRTLAQTLFRRVETERLTSFAVLDVGAGSGELLRVTANWARQTKKTFRGVGLELNRRSIEALRDESKDYPEVKAVRGDALRLPFHDKKFDYAICSLFTHHFKEAQIIRILEEMDRVAQRKIFVIDLHRHPIAYLLYTTLGKLVLHTRLLREDGALSILKAFNIKELKELGESAHLANITVDRHFPFRLVLSGSSKQSGPTTVKIDTATVDRAA